MKQLRLINPLILTLCLFFGNALAQSVDEWNTSKSVHFIVYYKNAPENFINELISASEEYYDRITEKLGFTRYNFWLWDKRAKIYIYDDAKDYQVKTQKPAWSAGAAHPKEKIIQTFPYAEGFFKRILPHEMGHIIFREFVGFDNYAIPAWLDEGVASYLEDSEYPALNILLKDAMAKSSLVPIEKLSEINPQLIIDSPSVRLFYAEAVSIVGYLVGEFGKDNFALFCQNLRDKMNLERALGSVYSFKGKEGLNEAWQSYLKK